MEIKWKPIPISKEIWETAVMSHVEAALHAAGQGQEEAAMLLLRDGIMRQTYTMRDGYAMERPMVEELTSPEAYRVGLPADVAELKMVAIYSNDNDCLMVMGMVRTHEGGILLGGSGPQAEYLNVTFKEVIKELNLSPEKGGDLDHQLRRFMEAKIDREVDDFREQLDELLDTWRGGGDDNDNSDG